MIFGTAGNTRLRIDSSGHMGLGVTPSAWPTNNDYKGLQVGSGACIFGRGSGDEDRGGIAVNYYGTTSGAKYITNGHGSRIYMADGNIYFQNADQNSSGAGAAMTLNTRLQIASDGTSHFYGNQTTAPEGDFGFRWDRNQPAILQVTNTNNTSVNAGAQVKLKTNAGNIAFNYVNNGGFYITNSVNGYLNYIQGGTPRFYIRNNGNIGINETSTQQLLHVHNDTNYQGILINGNSAPRIAFARSTTTTGEWSVGVDGTNGNNFCINNSNDNSNRKFIISSTQISSLMNHSVSGNVILANAGSGIDFSATSDGGTGTPSELLDDYEEGYFAPTIENLTSGYASGTFYNRQCRYTKVGNMVTVWGHIQFWANAATSGSDGTEFSILGFPFEVDGVGYRGTCGGSVVAQSWKYQGSGWNNYNVDSSNVQCGINGNEQIRFFVFKHDSITGTVTQKSINGYSPNIEWCFTVRVTTYK